MIADIDKTEEVILESGYSLDIVAMSPCTAIIERFNNNVHEQTIPVTDNQVLSFSQYLTEQRFLIAVSVGSLDFQTKPVDETIKEIIDSSSTTPTTTKTSAYSILNSDYTIRCDASSAAFAVTLPNATANQGNVFVIKKIDSTGNGVTIATTSSQTIDGSLTAPIYTQYQSLTVQSNGTNWDII